MSISVVIPCFNSENTIERCLLSVLMQTTSPSEIVCVDDGSSDKTVEILKKIRKKFVKDVSFKIILQSNSGPSVARNIGVHHSNGQYIAFLDSDDVWHPKKLEIAYRVITELKLNFIYHLYSPFPLLEEVDFDNVSIKSRKKSEFALKNFIATPTVLLKKDFFCKFPEHLSYCEDYCCWLLTNQDVFFFIDLHLANGFKKPLGESGLSSNINKMHKGFLKGLFYLKKEKKITLLFFVVAYIFEYFKFPLRYFR